MRTSTGKLHATYTIPFVCDSVTQLRRQQAKVIHTHAYATVRNIEQGEATHRKY